MHNVDELKRHPAIIHLYTSRVRLKREGKEMLGLCPLPDHKEKTPSFRIYERDGVLLWKCFGCSGSGNIFQLLEKLDRIPFNKAVEQVREYINNSWGSQKDAVEKVFKPFSESGEKQYKVYPEPEYKKLEKALAESKEAQAFLLTERGISLETAQRLRFGFRQDVGKLAGAANEDCASRGWISFPTFNGSTVTSVKYRSIVRKCFTKQSGMGTFLFNTAAIDFLEPLYVLEGEFDVAALDQIGLRAISVPNATTTITPEMKDQMLQAECVILAGDCDNAAGTKLMQKLWAEMSERTYLLQWPTGMKDANQTFLEHCKRDLSVFRTCVAELTTQARSTPMPNVYSLAEAMLSSDRVGLADHPLRFRFPWRSVDRMAVLLPGSVATVAATNSKMGKTQWVMNATLHAARRHNEVVVNYQAELSQDEFANMVAAHVLQKDRNNLTTEDYKTASNLLSGIKYYIGRNPTLNTIGPVLDLLEAAIRRLGATVVVIDHLHFLCRNSDREIQDQADAMQRLKGLAVKYGCKVFVVSQPRKSQQATKGKLIHITDLKGSEAVGSDADAIFAIHRDYIKIKDPENPPKDDYQPMTEIHLLGARSKGEGNTFTQLMFVGACSTFVETVPEPTGNLYGK